MDLTLCRAPHASVCCACVPLVMVIGKKNGKRVSARLPNVQSSQTRNYRSRIKHLASLPTMDMGIRSLLVLSLAARCVGEANVAQIVRTYTPMRAHPALFDSKVGWKQWMSPPLIEALIELRDTGNETALRALLREEVPGVYSFELFNAEFCDMFLEELDNYYASGLPVYRPCAAPGGSVSVAPLTRRCRPMYRNSMNNYGIIVNHIGLRPVISKLQRLILQPISDVFFPTQSAGGFTGHHSFMVKYKAGEDLGLDMHTDDSDGVPTAAECRSALRVRSVERGAWGAELRRPGRQHAVPLE